MTALKNLKGASCQCRKSAMHLHASASRTHRHVHRHTCSLASLRYLCPASILLFECEVIIIKRGNLSDSICWPAWLLSRGPLHLVCANDWCGKGDEGLWSATGSLNEPFKYRQTEIHKKQIGGCEEAWGVIHSKGEMCKKMLLTETHPDGLTLALIMRMKISFIGKTGKGLQLVLVQSKLM